MATSLGERKHIGYILLVALKDSSYIALSSLEPFEKNSSVIYAKLRLSGG
jgi:hypothetical protein